MATHNSTPVVEVNSSAEKSEKHLNLEHDAEVGQIQRHVDSSASDLGKPDTQTGDDESIEYKTLAWWYVLTLPFTRPDIRTDD